jgi:hypothetical protein
MILEVLGLGAFIGALLWIAFSDTKESYSYRKEKVTTLKRYPNGRVERYEDEDFEDWEF